MKRIYLASPYSHPDRRTVTERVRLVAAVTARLNERGGLNVYSPIVHGHHLPHPEHLAKSDSFWRNFNEDEIRRSDEVWVLALPGWESSVGVSREINYAHTAGKPVFLIDHETLAPQTACAGGAR